MTKRVSRPRDPVTKAIQSIGLSPSEFVRQYLDPKPHGYEAFRYRVRNGRLRMDEIHKIIFYTGWSFESLFPNPYKRQPPAKISLNLKPTTTTSRLAPQEKKEGSVSPSLTPKKEVKKKEAEPLPPDLTHDNQINNIFWDGLPPVGD